MSAIPPLDTPHDWFTRIAQRQAEVQEHGLAEALRRWNARGEIGAAVLATMGVAPAGSAPHGVSGAGCGRGSGRGAKAAGEAV